MYDEIIPPLGGWPQSGQGVYFPTLLTNIGNSCLYRVYNNDYNCVVFR